jgi:uncharacterized membrane protein
MVFIGYPLFFPARNKAEAFQEEVKKEKKANPDKNRPVYDEAYGILIEYIENNLNQNKKIYWLTIFIIFVGFVMIALGIWKSFSMPSDSTVNQSWPAIVAGAVTEFIAATILFMYKSVFEQTTDYSRTLERMTSVRVAIEIIDDLDNIGTESGMVELKAKARIEVAKQLLQFQHKD